MPTKQNEMIASRELLYSIRGENLRRKLTIRIFKPSEVDAGSVNFQVDPGTACCRVEFDGLNEPEYIVYGADTLQALGLAVNIDPVLRGLNKKYDFFFNDGEAYFDEQ